VRGVGERPYIRPLALVTAFALSRAAYMLTTIDFATADWSIVMFVYRTVVDSAPLSGRHFGIAHCAA
jgi:hypothetical protein